MRGVADHAAFHPQGGMLINVGPAFFDMALNACLPIGGIEARAIDASVRVMTIGTFQEALRHTVVHRQRELSLDVAVTAKAQIRLWLFEKTVVEPAHLF